MVRLRGGIIDTTCYLCAEIYHLRYSITKTKRYPRARILTLSSKGSSKLPFEMILLDVKHGELELDVVKVVALVVDVLNG